MTQIQGNLALKEVFDIPQLRKPAIQPVDIAHYNKLLDFLDQFVACKKTTNKDNVVRYIGSSFENKPIFFKSAKSPLDHKTVYGMIERGIVCRNPEHNVLSVHRALKITDYATKIAALERLAAITFVVVYGKTQYDTRRVEDFTPETVRNIINNEF